MHRPAPSYSIMLAIAFTAVALAVSGCAGLPGGPAPSVTVTAPYVPPSSTPMPTATPVPSASPATSWNGDMVKLYGNVSVKGGEHVYGVVKIYYMDENYWEEHPSVKYDTEEGGTYSLDVMANVPFKVNFGYLYVGQLPGIMNTKLLDKVYTLGEDTRLDLEVMPSKITPVR